VDSERLGWGVIGLGRIASTQVAPGIVASAGSSLISVVSRDPGRAEEFAQMHGAAHALDDYAKMLADPAVEAVYIATPNALHAEQVIAAARAGKHVLHDAYRHTIEAFADAVRGGRDPSPSGEDGLRSVEVTAAVAEAIRERRVVSLH
jgi:predicted dehydrogenase